MIAELACRTKNRRQCPQTLSSFWGWILGTRLKNVVPDQPDRFQRPCTGTLPCTVKTILYLLTSLQGLAKLVLSFCLGWA